MALSIIQLRQRLQTDLGDDAIGALLACTVEAIERVAPSGPTAELIGARTGRMLQLSYPAESIASVKEGTHVVPSTDYDLRPSGTLLLHLHRPWRGLVDVAYQPRVATASYEAAQVLLVDLLSSYKPGLAGQTIGAWTETYASADDKFRHAADDILRTLVAQPPLVMF